jgi:ferredoxin
MDEKGTGPMRHSALLQPSGRAFTATADRTLLLSAAEAGIAMTSSCRNGTCRACLRPLHAGRVAYRIEWPGLLPEEKAGGWVLPCVAYPQSDVVLGD